MILQMKKHLMWAQLASFSFCMAYRSQSALASLTATYTDSEGEEEVDVDTDQNESAPSKSPATSSGHSTTGTPQKADLGKIARLVSYQDEDAALSDDERGIDVELLAPLLLRGRPPSAPEVQQVVTEESPDHEASEMVVDDIRLPPEPKGKCSKDLQDKIMQLRDKACRGMDMNFAIQNKKSFRNPSIYEKLIQYCEIDEFGTNYPPESYDPHSWDEKSFYDELAKVQRQEMDRREKEKKERTKVEFVSGTAKRPAEDDLKKRKSKWDQVGNVHIPASLPMLKPAGLLQQASLTASATGTKSTVISAFGSLPKKPRL